jgi:hypothetical protein
MIEQPEFHPFQKIARLSRDIVITEKIDGTNGVIFIPDAVEQAEFKHNPIYAGSRNRWIEPGNDNFGFAAWVHMHYRELIDGFGPGYHFGEWWGQGIQRGYGLDHKRFSVFNPFRYEKRPACVDVVPVLFEGPFSTGGAGSVERALTMLRVEGSKAAPGFMDPEGVVVYHTASKALFKKTIHGDEKPKGSAE